MTTLLEPPLTTIQRTVWDISNTVTRKAFSPKPTKVNRLTVMGMIPTEARLAHSEVGCVTYMICALMLADPASAIDAQISSSSPQHVIELLA